MASYIVRVEDRPNVEAEITRPGDGGVRHPSRKSTRYLGLEGDDFTFPKSPPFAYFIERPAGDVTHDHSHSAGRTEFVIEGKIEWREPGQEPRVYSAGTLSYVEANTVYGYTVLEDAKILILFDRSPGMNYR